MVRVTVIAFDKDSSANYTETFPVTDNLKSDIETFETRIPFSRYYFESELDDIGMMTARESALLDEAGLDVHE